MTDSQRKPTLGTHSGGLIIQAPEGEGVNLGNLQAVQALVHQFAGGVVAIWGRFTDGEATQDESLDALRALAAGYASIWKGERPGFRISPWRTPPVLAGKIVAWVPGIGGDGDPITRYFMWLGRQILTGAQEVTDGMAMEEAGPRLKAILQDAAEKLSGVQP